MATETSASAPSVDDACSTIKQPIGTVFGERSVDTVSPLNNTHARLKQPISTIFGEGNTIGSPDNKSTNVILDADGKPRRLVLNHQQYGYTESSDLTVVRQPITTRFGDPMVRQAVPEIPVPQVKYVDFEHPKPAPPLSKTFKKQNKFSEF